MKTVSWNLPVVFSAITLDHTLQKLNCRDRVSQLGQKFQRQLSKITAIPWMLVTSEDYRYRGTEGQPPTWTTKLMHRYIDRVVKLPPSIPKFG